ncbi:MAG: zeta toxin family protein [Christensenellales bacterium]
MKKKTIDKILDMYKLSNKELDKIFNTIVSVLSEGRQPVNNPVAIIVGGQSGAGKTSLMAFTNKEFYNAVQIDNDTFRAFHPKADEIRKLYPEFYREATDQLGIGLTSRIVNYFMGDNPNGDKYDIIFHQTLKNNRIADDAMTKFHDSGYIVEVRAFAVSYFESKMSQIERCKAQYETMGFCRHVDPTAHIEAIKGIPFTLSYMEESGKYDILKIYMRSDNIAKPTLIYTNTNPETRNEIKKIYLHRWLAYPKILRNGCTSAKEAINKGRQLDTIRCVKTLSKRIVDAKSNGGYDIPGMAEHIDEIEQVFNEYLHHNIEPFVASF